MSFRLFAGALLLTASFLLAPFCSAQEPPSCSLGRITERIAPEYPDALNGRPVQGVVSILATFARRRQSQQQQSDRGSVRAAL